MVFGAWAGGHESPSVVEFIPEPCFKPFGDAVSDARRAGNVDPSKAIIADTMKLVSLFHSRKHGVGTMYISLIENLYLYLSLRMGNSGSGKTITNQLKHRIVEYCSDAEASRKVNTPLFRKLNNITKDTYEVESCKKIDQVKFTDSSRIFRVSVCQAKNASILL